MICPSFKLLLAVGAVALAEPTRHSKKQPKLSFVVVGRTAVRNRMSEVLGIQFHPVSIHLDKGNNLEKLGEFLVNSRKTFSKISCKL